MEKAKKFNVKNLIIAMLSVLLLASVAVGGTMAWFLDQKTASSTLTMGGAVNINIAPDNKYDTEAAAVTFSGSNLVPGQPIESKVFVNMAQSTTKAFFRLKVEITGTDAGTLTTEFNDQIKAAAAAKGWKLGNDQYYYYVGTEPAVDNSNVATVESDSTVMEEVDATAAAKSITFLDGTVNVPTDWTNDVALKSVTVKFTAEAIQSTYLDASSPSTSNTISAVAAVMDDAFGIGA